MAKYKKRKDGRYHTSITLDGKKYELYSKSIKELDKKVIELRVKYEQGLMLKSPTVLFKDYKERWFEAKKPMISAKSIASYQSILDNHFTRIDYMKVVDIKKTDVQYVINDLIDKPNTANKTYMTLNQILENAVDDDILNKNPCRVIKKPKIETKEKRILTDEEFYLTEVADFNDREKMFVIMSKYCGLRPEETRALTKDDFFINNNSGYVRINKTVVYVSNQAIFQQFTKNSSSIRDIPLFANILPFVRYYLSSIQTNKLFTNLSNKKDEYMSSQSYKWLIKKIKDKIRYKAWELKIEFNEKGFTAYTFRHTYATLLYYSGINLKEAEYYMGHADSKMLNQVYIHLDKQALRENNSIEDYIKNKLILNKQTIQSKTSVQDSVQNQIEIEKVT